jgi:hypothetical protein
MSDRAYRANARLFWEWGISPKQWQEAMNVCVLLGIVFLLSMKLTMRMAIFDISPKMTLK